jgi:hypothetical protein
MAYFKADGEKTTGIPETSYLFRPRIEYGVPRFPYPSSRVNTHAQGPPPFLGDLGSVPSTQQTYRPLAAPHHHACRTGRKMRQTESEMCRFAPDSPAIRCVPHYPSPL